MHPFVLHRFFALLRMTEQSDNEKRFLSALFSQYPILSVPSFSFFPTGDGYVYCYIIGCGTATNGR